MKIEIYKKLLKNSIQNEIELIQYMIDNRIDWQRAELPKDHLFNEHLNELKDQLTKIDSYSTDKLKQEILLIYNEICDIY